MSLLPKLALLGLRAVMLVGWLCAVLMAAQGSVHLTCAYPLAVAVRTMGFGMLVFVTTSLAATALEDGL